MLRCGRTGLSASGPRGRTPPLAESEAALREYIEGPVLLAQPLVDVAWWRLGQVLEKQGKVVPAREAYQKAIAMEDSDFNASLRQLDASSARKQ